MDGSDCEIINKKRKKFGSLLWLQETTTDKTCQLKGKTQNYFLVFVYLPFGLTPPLSTSNCGQFIYHFSRFWELTSYIRGNNRILGEIKRETRDNLEAFPLTLVAGTKHGMKMEGRER